MSEQDYIAAAGYLIGIRAGLLYDRSPSWQKRCARSWVVSSHVFDVARLVLAGGAYNPLDAWDMMNAAQKLGYECRAEGPLDGKHACIQTALGDREPKAGEICGR